MKVAIHDRKGSFSDRWIEYCISKNIDYIKVNCHHTDIIEILRKNNITHLLWHINHQSYVDLMIASNILNALDIIGIKTFPNFHTRFHFDDKISQKYLLESINAPLVPSYVFYNKNEAIKFIKKTSFPIVGKLKRGAGSNNVLLLKSENEAIKYVEKLFSTGIISTAKPLENIHQKYRIAKQIKNPYYLLKKFTIYLSKNKKERSLGNIEKGYSYFQNFMPNNTFDTRIIVVNNIAFGIRRYTRKDDFRASGSGIINYDSSEIDIRTVQISFDIAKKISTQSLAFDYVYDEKGNPKIVEICFGFSMKAYDSCEGYWLNDLTFVKGKFNPQEIMISNFLSES